MHRLIATARILIADPLLIVVLLVWRVVMPLSKGLNDDRQGFDR